MKLKLMQWNSNHGGHYFIMEPINVKYGNLFDKIRNMLYISHDCFIGAITISSKLN